MIIETDVRFEKHLKKRVKSRPKLYLKFKRRLELFVVDSSDPLLRDHELAGVKRGYRAFSITGNFRVIYRRLAPNKVIFIDIGTHPQVY